MAQSVKRPTLGFSLSHGLRVIRLSPVSGSILSMEFADDSLFPSAPPPLHVQALSLTLKQLNLSFFEVSIDHIRNLSQIAPDYCKHMQIVF